MSKRVLPQLVVMVLLLLLVLLPLSASADLARQEIMPEMEPEPESTVLIDEGPVNVIESTNQRLSFALNTAMPTQSADGTINMPELDRVIEQPGAPALPFYSTLIALPPGADVTVTSSALGVVARDSSATIMPTVKNVSIDVNDDEELLIDEFARLNIEESEATANQPLVEIYEKDALFPLESAVSGSPTNLRDLRLVEISVYPVRYNPVQNTLEHAQRIMVEVTFNGPQLVEKQELVPEETSVQNALMAGILNRDRADGWFNMEAVTPASRAVVATAPLPVGQDAFKIEIFESGIYELTQADLSAAGMDITSIDPTSFQMMYRGNSIAYEWVGNWDSIFDIDEKIRFYGWAFEGASATDVGGAAEKDYVRNNVYWLWANGTATTIGSKANVTNAPLKNSFNETVVYGPNIYWRPSNTEIEDWNAYGVDPVSWYADSLLKTVGVLASKSYDIQLANPDTASAQPGTLQFGMQTYKGIHNLSIYPTADPSAATTTDSFSGLVYRTVAGNFPASSLVNGTNGFTLAANNGNTSTTAYYLDEIQVQYPRLTIAVDDLLIIDEETSSDTSYNVSGFSNNSPIVWDVTNKEIPVAISVSGSDITGSGAYTYNFGSAHAQPATYAVASENGMSTPLSIEKYTVADITPSDNVAEWLVLSHEDFIGEANRLAAHRQDETFGGFDTFIVDIEDVINQYGYGLPVPTAIIDYLKYTQTWSTAPFYILLFGDTTVNPRNEVCSLRCNQYWEGYVEPQFVLTNNVYQERWDGLEPSDHPFAMLSGDDLVPDVAIGRITSQTVAEAAAVVDKTIQFETLQLSAPAYMNNIAFAADDTDAGGNFCLESENIAGMLPSELNTQLICAPDSDSATTAAIKADIYEAVNNDGVLALNYRGHGGVNRWALTTTADEALWTNGALPTISVSADCLDAYFGYPQVESLGESFMEIEGAGTVAHFGNTGLGFSYEHAVLHEGFYIGLFDQGLTRMGDVMVYAKTRYATQFLASGYDDSELFGFHILGDPALQIMRSNVEVEVDQVGGNTVPAPGSTIQYEITVSNLGNYPSMVSIENQLPSGFVFSNATSSSLFSTSTNVNGSLEFSLSDTLGQGESAVIIVNAQVPNNYDGTPMANVVTVDATGDDTDLTNNTASAEAALSCLSTADDLTITRNGSDVQLSWATGSGEVWHSNEPYFNPGDAGASLLATTSGSYTDVGAIGSVSANNYYVVRADDGACSRVGEFDYAIEENAWTMIAVPLEVGSLTADSLAATISANDGISRVSKWDASTQGWVSRNVGAVFGTPNFDVVTGDVVAVFAESSAPSSFAWVGGVPAYGELNFQLQAGWNMVILPLDEGTMPSISSADTFAEALLTNATRMGNWSATTQGWQMRNVGAAFGTADFITTRGYPYAMQVSATQQWP